MSDQPSSKPESDGNAERERSKQVSTAGWTVGVAAMFAMFTLLNAPTWPAAFGVAAVMGMVMVVCCYILKRC